MMKTEVWDLRHWKSRQLDLFLWNEVPEFVVEIPIVVNRNVRPIHTIIESNPMVTREIIDGYAEEISKKIDEEIMNEMRVAFGMDDRGLYLNGEWPEGDTRRMGDRSRV